MTLPDVVNITDLVFLPWVASIKAGVLLTL